MNVREELKSAISNDKVMIGAKSVLKNIKAGDLDIVVVSTNCPKETRKDLDHYAKISELKVLEFDGTAKQLGTFCGKPFQIAVIAIKK